MTSFMDYEVNFFFKYCNVVFILDRANRKNTFTLKKCHKQVSIDSRRHHSVNLHNQFNHLSGCLSSKHLWWPKEERASVTALQAFMKTKQRSQYSQAMKRRSELMQKARVSRALANCCTPRRAGLGNSFLKVMDKKSV